MLHDIQRQFINAIYSNDMSILNSIDNSRRTAASQLEIYKDSVFGGLLNALSEIYPVTKRLLGEEFFNAMCMCYIKYAPSVNPDINAYGENFPEFIDGFEPTKDLIYLSDVMKLEWAWHVAYQAEKVIYADLTSLLKLSSATLQHVHLKLNPTASLLYSRFPIHRIWQLNQSETTENDNDEKISLDEGESYLFIWRNKIDMHIDLITEDMFILLSSVKENHSLGHIQQTVKNFEQNLSSALGKNYFHCYVVD